MACKSYNRKKSLGGIVSNTAQGAVTGLSVGGPWGALAGGVIGLGSGLLQHDQEQTQLEEEQAAIAAQEKADYRKVRTQQLLAEATPNLNNPAQMEYGGFIKYDKGQSHKGPNGGIPIDAQGNPTATSGKEAVATAEQGEVTWVQPDGTAYVFSDKLGYAKDAKKIMNRYKIRLGKNFDGEDSLARAGMNYELNALKAKNEIARLEQTPDEELQLQFGGDPEDLSYETNLWGIDEFKDYVPPIEKTIPGVTITGNGSSILPNANIRANSQVSTPAITGERAGIEYNNTPQSSIEPWMTEQFDVTDNTTNNTAGVNKELEPYSPTASYLTSGASAITGAASNLALAFGRSKPVEYNPALVGAESIDLSGARETIRSRGSFEKAASRNLARKTGISKAQDIAQSNLASATVERNVGEQTAALYSQEKQFNAQARQTAAGINQQAISQGRQFNAMRQDQFDRDTNQYIESAVGNLTSGAAEINRIKQGSDYLDILGARSGYQLMIDPETGEKVLAPIPGYFERYK